MNATHLELLRNLPSFLLGFARDPIGTMKKPLRVSWPAILSLQAGAAILSGTLVGLFSGQFWDFVLGCVVLPITSILISLVLSFFVYYFFSVFHSTFLEFRRLHGIVALSTLPYFVLHLASGYLPPIDLIGFALATLLLIVGLIEQFDLPRRTVIGLLGGLYLVFFLIWGAAQYNSI